MSETALKRPRFEFGSNFDDEPEKNPPLDGDAQNGVAYARGFTDGQQAERSGVRAKAVNALEALSTKMKENIESLTSWQAEIEKNFAALALAFSKKLSCDLLERFPLSPLEAMLKDLAREGLKDCRIIIKTSSQTADPFKEDIQKLVAEHFENPYVRIEDDDALPPQNYTVEWEKGGFVFDKDALEKQMTRIIEETFPPQK